jgi:protein phosphatase
MHISSRSWDHFSCEAHGLSDVGRTATQNEDAFAVLPEERIFIVADGIGGSVGGEVASAVAASVVPMKLEKRLRALPKNSGRKKVETTIREVMEDVNKTLVEHGRKVTGDAGPGTTIVMATIWKDYALITHLGDSRAYLWHDNVLHRLTEDHALAAQLVRWGKLSESQARDNPGRSTLLRYLGADEELAPDFCWVTPCAGDVLLLCTDGLTNMVDDKQITEILAAPSTLEEGCGKLIQSANQAGGKDNITVVLIRFHDPVKTDRKTGNRNRGSS